MRALEFALVLVVVGALVFLLIQWVSHGSTGSSVRSAHARWQADTELSAGHTVVVVRRLAGDTELGRQVVASIPDKADDWDVRYHEAMAEARSRAAALEAESG